MSAPEPNQRCIERLAFLLLNEPEAQCDFLLAKVVEACMEYGQREGWPASDTLEFTRRFGDATLAAMRQQLGRKEHEVQ